MGNYLYGVLCALGFASLSACAQPQPKEPPMPVYDPQALYFHYFKLDVPSDVNLDDAIIEANFSGNRFHAYPIASQQAFDALVQERINVFKQHKLSQEALDYGIKKKDGLEFADEEVKQSYPDLKMTTALYKVIKVDDQHYSIIANPLSNLDRTMTANMFIQWYIYVPEQGKYIMTKQAMIPSSSVVASDMDDSARDFIKTQIRPFDVALLKDPKVMALGPVAWIDADFHPKIEYRIQSKQPKMEIYLLVESAHTSKYTSVYTTQKERIRQLKYDSENKAQVLDKGNITLAGEKGQNYCYYVPSRDVEISDHYVWCSWGTDGQKEDLDHPSIFLEMRYPVNGSMTQQQTALAAWQQLLHSFQRRGHS